MWPAFALFVGFAWMELVWSGRSVPAELAGALALYSVATLTGMAVFGRATIAADVKRCCEPRARNHVNRNKRDGPL